MGTGLLDLLVFSSVWVAWAAGALALAAGAAMDVPPDPGAAGLAFLGTLVVYNVDRLRDLDRDRATAPDRAAFVAAHRRPLWTVVAAAAAGSVLLAWRQEPPVWGLLAAVLGLGLLHRRLKHLPFFKAGYLVAAWLAVVVGVPALASRQAGGPAQVGWVAGVIGGALAANVIASNLRDRENAAGRIRRTPALALGGGIALAAAALAALGPRPVWPLAAVPAATLAALLAFRPGERYALLVVDGALLVGALAALALPHALGGAS